MTNDLTDAVQETLLQLVDTGWAIDGHLESFADSLEQMGYWLQMWREDTRRTTVALTKLLKALGGGDAPDKITDLRVIPGENQVWVHWRAAARATSYLVVVLTPKIVQRAPAKIEGLEPGKTYPVAVVARNDYGISEAVAISFTMPGGGPPAMPIGLKVAFHAHSAVAMWRESEGAASYTTRLFFSNEEREMAVDEPPAVFNGLTPGTDYVFHVRAENEYGESKFATLTFTTPEDSGKPGFMRILP